MLLTVRISSKTRRLCVRTVAESFNVRLMNHVARSLIRNYDLHERTGFPDSMTIPARDAAAQLVDDFLSEGRFVELVQELARISSEGLAGRRHRVRGLTPLIHEIEALGYRFNAETSTFSEDTHFHTTRNWGVLEEGQTYVFSLMRIDVVGNSRLVQKYPDETIQYTYSDLRMMFREVVEFRGGRVWNWEGDGATAAFYGADTQPAAALSAVALIHELFFYNALRRRIEENLLVRVAVHNGQLEYRSQFEEMKSPVLERLVEIESKYTKPQSAYMSETVFTGLVNEIAEWLEPVRIEPGTTLYRYRLQFGDG